MLATHFCKKFCWNNIPVRLGNSLGAGVDGEVFEIVDNPHKVIKLSIVFNLNNDLEDRYSKIENVIKFIMSSDVSTYVCVYEHKLLGSFEDTSFKRFILYYSILEKLNKISEDERKVFFSILSHEDRGIVKDFPIPKIQDMLIGMSYGLDFDMVKVIDFCQKIKESPLVHLDLDGRNIMKDANGNFKLIDLDRVKLEK